MDSFCKMFGRTPKNQRKVLQHVQQHIHVSMRDMQYKTRSMHSGTYMKQKHDVQIKYLEKCVVCNSVKKLNIYTLQDIYKYFDLKTQFKFSSTCKKYYALKCTITSLIVDDYMTDVSLTGLVGVTYVDCDRNVFLTDDCFRHIPNVLHFCCGFNTNFTHKIFSNLPKMILLECDDNEHMIKKNTYDIYTNNSDRDSSNIFDYFNKTETKTELSMLYDYVMRDIRCSYYTRHDNPSIMLRISCNPGQRFSSDGKIIVEWKHRKNTAEYTQWLKNIRTFELIKTIDALHYKQSRFMICGVSDNSPLSVWLKAHQQHTSEDINKFIGTKDLIGNKKQYTGARQISRHNLHSTQYHHINGISHDGYMTGYYGVYLPAIALHYYHNAEDYSSLYFIEHHVHDIDDEPLYEM